MNNNNNENPLDSLGNSQNEKEINELKKIVDNLNELLKKYKAIELKNVDEEGNVSITGYSPSINFKHNGLHVKPSKSFSLLDKVVMCNDSYGSFFYMEKNAKGEIIHFGSSFHIALTSFINEKTKVRGFKTYKEFNKYRELSGKVLFENNKFFIK